MNPLDPIIDWYRTTYDALRITRRIIDRNVAGALSPKYVFHMLSANESAAKLSVAAEQLNNLTVLALVALFERTLRDYVIEVIRSRFGAPPAVEAKISENVQKDTEFWNFSARLIDVFANVDPRVRGQAKQFIDFRNWVAHARHAAAVPEPAPRKADPGDAYQVLSDFLRQAGLV